ncbi:MAG: ABC transporter permease [Anaerolineaceae bacterium]|nr:ABC transporter permease [Anaerolineaceae bacterium]
MKSSFMGLFTRQIDVQLRMRTLNLYSLLLWFIQPIVFSAVGMILSNAAGNPAPDLVYTVIGGGIMGMWSGLVFTSTYDIRSDRREGTLEIIVGSPTSLRKVEAIRTFSNVAAGSISLIAAFLVAVLIYKFPLSQADLLSAVISLLVILFGLWCMGVFLANLMVWSRLSTSIVEFIEMPVALLAGFMYPIRILPAWMQEISSIFPIRWGLETLRTAIQGPALNQETLVKWAISIGISLIIYLLSRLLDHKVHDLIRVSGELSSI